MTIETTFQLILSDYRKAAYYGLVQRNRKAMRIAAFVMLAVLSYTIFMLISGGELLYILIYIAGAYLIWGLFLFAKQEREIRSYLQNKDNVLGKDFEMRFDGKSMRVRLQEKGVDNTFEVRKLAIVFELSELFIIYATQKDAYLLPKRALEEEQVKQLRTMFTTQLGDRFESRFLKRK